MENISSIPTEVVENGPQSTSQGQNSGSDSNQPSEQVDVEAQGDGPNDNSKLKSIVWQHFERKTIGGVVKAICNYCNKKLGGDSKNGTKHLHGHMERCPRKSQPDIRQKVLVNNLKRKEVSPYVYDEAGVRQELASMIIMHEYPLVMVEHAGFRKYSISLQPLFKVPVRNTVKNDILKIFDCERGKTMKLLEKNESRVAITTDMWTSSNQKRGFMAVTGHFIDGGWTLQSYILRFVYVPSPHTSEVLCETLLDCLMDWSVDRKLSTITVDNCSTNDAFMGIIKDKLDRSSLIRSGSLIHMRCCAHILNLIVKDGLDVIKEGIEKIRDSVVYWTATPKRLEKFEEAAKQLRIPVTKKLGLDCPTRWNSTFLMLQTAMLYKNVFNRLKQREPQYKTLPCESDWEFAREVCERLKIFYRMTELFSGTKYPTANMYFPNICEIRLQISTWLGCEIDVISKMATSMLTKFEKYWGVVHEIMGVAAVLDPRYKMTLLEYYFPKVYGADSLVQVENIRKLCYDLVNDYQSAFDSGGAEGDSMSVDPVNHDGGVDKLSDYDLFVRVKKSSRTSSVKSELDHYLDEDVLPRREDFDILLWWKINGVKYPTLRAIARDILAIPVSTVASESAFSTSGRIVSPHRSRLHPKMLEALMCARSWLWAAENKEQDDASSSGYGTIYDEVDSDGEGTIID